MIAVPAKVYWYKAGVRIYATPDLASVPLFAAAPVNVPTLYDGGMPEGAIRVGNTTWVVIAAPATVWPFDGPYKGKIITKAYVPIQLLYDALGIPLTDPYAAVQSTGPGTAANVSSTIMTTANSFLANKVDANGQPLPQPQTGLYTQDQFPQAPGTGTKSDNSKTMLYIGLAAVAGLLIYGMNKKK